MKVLLRTIFDDYVIMVVLLFSISSNQLSVEVAGLLKDTERQQNVTIKYVIWFEMCVVVFVTCVFAIIERLCEDQRAEFSDDCVV